MPRGRHSDEALITQMPIADADVQDARGERPRYARSEEAGEASRTRGGQRRSVRAEGSAGARGGHARQDVTGDVRQDVADDAREGRPAGGHARPASHRAGAPREGQFDQNRYVRETITKWRMRAVMAFGIIMVLGGLIGLAFFARPTTSAVEMRNLTKFPEFSAQSFKDGSFFTDVSLWYADTYPLRESMVAADHAIDSLFGVSVNGAMVGGNVVADEIPVDEAAEDGQSSASAEQKPQVTAPAEPPDERAIAEDIQNNIMEGVYTKDGAAYSIYYFDQSAADAYIAAMNTAVENLDGVATVYSIMSPANSITLDPEEAAKVGGSDQQQTLNYLSTRYDSRVHQVEIVDDIIAHRDEYLYFYTDHHWTQLGAYYAYVEFCKEKGIEPHELSFWKHENYGDFNGTYYDTLASIGEVRQDTVDAWIPSGTNTMKYWPDGTDGEELEAPVVDQSAVDWEPSFKYSCFIQGDQPLQIIKNPAITDGSSVLVVKDSYGDAFAPLLVDNYETVYVIDFRETDKNICDYVREQKIGDVIFLTGMKIGLTETVATTLLSEVS